ncbi:MAG: hypothetical protein QXN63_05390 [Candidatus Bathyarchaeia archaeon]
MIHVFPGFSLREGYRFRPIAPQTIKVGGDKIQRDYPKDSPEYQKALSFSQLEILKMLKQIDDTLRKINSVCGNLQKANNMKDFMILVQASQSLMELHRKLSRAVKKQKKKPGLKIPTVGISAP